jgi:hypothetical protein
LTNSSLSQGNQKHHIQRQQRPKRRPNRQIQLYLPLPHSQFEQQHEVPLQHHALNLTSEHATIPRRLEHPCISSIQGVPIVINLLRSHLQRRRLEQVLPNFYDLQNGLDNILEILLLQCGFIIILPLSVSIPPGLRLPLLLDKLFLPTKLHTFTLRHKHST